MDNKKRLIDASAVVSTIECVNRRIAKYETDYAKGLKDAYYDVKELVLNVPTIDAVEVVHGRWIEKPNPWGQDGSHSYDCSICGERTCVVGHKLRYCPNCGAKMDGERYEA